jgi:hypothetical protein
MKGRGDLPAVVALQSDSFSKDEGGIHADGTGGANWYQSGCVFQAGEGGS